MTAESGCVTVPESPLSEVQAGLKGTDDIRAAHSWLLQGMGGGAENGYACECVYVYVYTHTCKVLSSPMCAGSFVETGFPDSLRSGRVEIKYFT